MATKNIMRSHLITSVAAALVCVGLGATLVAQATPSASFSSPITDYIVGPQDVLTITSYDQADLSGKFSVEADGTFTYPMIGRFKAGGLTLRAAETQLKAKLKDEGYFNNPQITIAVEQYRSQKVFVVGEVRSPGPYPITGDMKLIEALARAESIYVFGQVKNPGAYALQQRATTVLQALSLAGGVTDRGSTSRIRIVRIIDGQKKDIKVTLGDTIRAGDTIIVSERFL
jgi:protein involved in polysaccharide export with SLBB domain